MLGGAAIAKHNSDDWETLCRGYAVATFLVDHTQRRSMRAASRRPPRYSARARSRSRLEHHDAALRGACRALQSLHRLSSWPNHARFHLDSCGPRAGLP